jgi:hypothetical protein
MDDQPPLLPISPYDAADDLSSDTLASETADVIVFLPLAPAEAQLAESIVYRPGVAVASALLAGPFVFAIGGAVAAIASGAIPVWLPLVLLLWLPLLALAWLLLKSVRVTPGALASGRPLGRWRVIPFEEIERVEQRGLHLVVSARSGPPLLFAPALLHRGAELRRSLLLRLPLRVLWGRLRVEAQDLSAGDGAARTEGDIAGVLTVRSRWVWSALAGASALAALALALLAWLALAAPLRGALALALAALAAACGYLCLWMAQEIFISEKGLIVHYPLLRRERVVFWAQVRQVEYTPAEMALLFRGVRRVACVGPGALSVHQARLMRQFISRYCHSQVAPLLARRSF